MSYARKYGKREDTSRYPSLEAVYSRKGSEPSPDEVKAVTSALKAGLDFLSRFAILQP